MDVERPKCIDAFRSPGHVEQVQVLERAQGTEIEDRTEVDVEPIEPLTGKHPHVAGKIVDRRIGEPGVVRGRPWSDVARWTTQILAEHDGPRAAPLVPRGPRHRIELLAVPRWAVDAEDLSGVVQERVGILDDRVEPEFVGDVTSAVTVVVDDDSVQHVVSELEEVRTTGRIFEWDVVADQRDAVGAIGADERVDVGAVCYRVLGDLRSFAVR